MSLSSPLPSHAAPRFLSTLQKRAVALHLGYLGSPYKGNQYNSTLARGSTVDDVVEDALLASGFILPTNYGSRGLSRLAWSRSSRTDKGVSSLATVCTCRLEVDPAWWASGDGDGEALCAAVNAKLPPTVTLLAASPVPKRFQARHACASRTYNYLLPLHALMPDPSAPVELKSPELAARLERLRAAMQLYVGTHPFHNFTHRARYRPAKANARRGAAEPVPVVQDEDADGEADEGGEESAMAAAVSVTPPGVAGAFSSGTYWCVTPQPGDAVCNAHFRRIMDVEVQEPQVSAQGGCAYVRIVLVGESFLIHQIRKMVGTAVACARGRLAMEFVEAALQRPARARTPVAPASTLVLADATFWPFKADTSGKAAPWRTSADGPGDNEEKSLQISDATHARMATWSATVLEPALGPALASAEWLEWVDNLEQACPAADEVDLIVGYAREYVNQRRAARQLDGEATERVASGV